MNSVKTARLFIALELLLLLSLVFAVLIPFSPLSQSLPSRDSGVFLYTGWRVLHGDIPYLQIWDHKPPVIYYLDALGLWLSPDSLWGVWILEVVSLWLATLAGYSLFKKLFGLFPAIISTCLWLFSAFYLLAGGNLTTEYAIIFQFSLLMIFFKAESQSRYGWYGVIIGAISAFLFFTRQNAIAIPVAVGIYVLAARSYQREFRRFVDDISQILAGGLIVSFVIIGYFGIKGALPAFWETAFVYNFSYADERDTVDRFNALAQGLNQLQNVGLAQAAFLGWGGALGLLIFKKERIKPESRQFLAMALIALPIELLMVSIGGRPRIPYFLTLLPVFSVFAGFGLWLVFDSLLRDIPNYAGALFTILLVLSLGSIFFADYSELAQSFMKLSSEAEIVRYIRDNSAPDDFVLMWGAETSYNFEARRVSPTRFVYQTPLYNGKNEDKVTEFLRDILKNKPRLIVLKSDDKFSDFRFGYRDDQIGALMDQIKGSYEDIKKVDGWQVLTYSGQ
ncbi:MAG: glycosyltransferase family 39 protein [Chloroflexi bacterium]|nr:glycosyltransferase family 39 protein [Chloroflexota bacterium]